MTCQHHICVSSRPKEGAKENPRPIDDYRQAYRWAIDSNRPKKPIGIFPIAATKSSSHTHCVSRLRSPDPAVLSHCLCLLDPPVTHMRQAPRTVCGIMMAPPGVCSASWVSCSPWPHIYAPRGQSIRGASPVPRATVGRQLGLGPGGSGGAPS